MNKIIKIIFIIFSIFTININAYAVNELPFQNMLISKKPVEYNNIIFNDYDDNNINLNNQKSKVYMLNFWATWCLPCKEEMPYLDNLQIINGLEIFPINVGEENKEKTKNFFNKLEIKNLSIYFDIENKLVNLFKLRGLPTTIILNEDKKEIARIVGLVDFSDKKFIDWLSNYLN